MDYGTAHDDDDDDYDGDPNDGGDDDDDYDDDRKWVETKKNFITNDTSAHQPKHPY